MLIAQITDTHITPPAGPDDAKMNGRLQALETFVAHINGLDEKPDLVLHTGDVTHGGKPEYYDIVKSIMSALPIPLYCSLGNRDLGENLVAAMKDLGDAALVDGFLMYSIDKFPVRLIAMDTQHRERNIGTTCSVRLCVLEEMLKEQPNTPTALFMHHPPFKVTAASDPYQFQFDDPVLADAFLQLIRQHSQVVHMFCGHMHRQYGVQLETCYASCAPSLPADNRLGEFPPDLDGKPLYQLHRWNANTGRFETSLHAAVN